MFWFKKKEKLCLLKSRFSGEDGCCTCCIKTFIRQPHSIHSNEQGMRKDKQKLLVNQPLSFFFFFFFCLSLIPDA